MKNIVITGASSGIGYALAKMLDGQKHHLILCGRNEKNLMHLSGELSGSHELKLFDVKDKTSVFKAFESIKNIDILVNNAGNAHGLATFDNMQLEDMEEMILGNVLGLLYVTKACIAQLKQSSFGQIVNISSIAGKEAYKNGTVYCASKSAVEMLSKGMRLDFSDFGIRVINIAPGAVQTNFSMVRFKGDQDKSKAVYDGFTPLQAQDIAAQIIYAIEAPKHVQIADITILPTAQASATTIKRE